MTVKPTAPALDPTITNATIRKCVEHSRNLRDEAMNLLKLLPLTLTQDQWQPVYQKEVLPFAQKIAKFNGLKKSAVTTANLLNIEQVAEKAKLETALKELDGRIGSVYTRIKELQFQQGIQPFFVYVSSTQKAKNWLNQNKGWVLSGVAGTVAATQLAPNWLTDPISTFSVGTYKSPWNNEYSIRPFYVPLFMLRESLGPKWSQTLGFTALGVSALYPTYRILKKPTLAIANWVDKKVDWLNNHPVLTLVASAGLSYAAMGHIDPKTPLPFKLPTDPAQRQFLAGGIGLGTTGAIWAAKTICDLIKSYAKSEEQAAPEKKPVVQPPPATVSVAANRPLAAPIPVPADGNVAAQPLLPVAPVPREDERTTLQKIRDFQTAHPFASRTALGSGLGAGIGTLAAFAMSWPIAIPAGIAAVSGGIFFGAAHVAAERELAAERARLVI